jgi:nucleoside-diphosphate-sugar epimerase
MSDENQAVPEKQSIVLTGADHALGQLVLQQLTARGHQVAGLAFDLEGARAVRAAGGLPVYCDAARAGEVASTMRMVNATTIVHLEPQRINHMPALSVDWARAESDIGAQATALAEALHMLDAENTFLVHTSYTFLYGDRAGAQVDETVELATDEPFFAAAARGEAAALEGPGCVLRAGYRYGPRDPHTAALRDSLVRGSAMHQGDGSKMANWLHEEDLAAAVILAVEARPAGLVCDLADNQPAPVTQFVEEFSAALGIQAPGSMTMPPVLARRMMNATHRAILETSVRVSAARAREVLGWDPQYADRARGLDQLLLQWRAGPQSRDIEPV